MNEASPTKESSDLAPGRLLAGKYEIVAEVSRGAMGRILKVHQRGLDRMLAAKIVAAEATGQESFKRLSREGKILTKLNHPNIVQVYSAAIDEEFGFVVVMDFLDGVTMAQMISKAKLTLDSTIEFARQIAQGLQFAHENGVLHRDLKPSNVMIVESAGVERAVVIDFGVAKIQHEPSQKLTQTGALLGTPLYMSPEQVRGEEIDARTDIYSFGCMLYEMITGVTPFVSDNWVELAAKQVNQQPQPLVNTCPKVVPDLEDIVLKCLKKNPEDRFSSMTEVLKALDSINHAASPRRSAARIKALPQDGRFRHKVALVAIPMLIAGLIGTGLYFTKAKDELGSPLPVLDFDANQISSMIDRNDLGNAKERLHQVISSIEKSSSQAARLPRLYVLLARADRLSGNYDAALKEIDNARSFKDKYDLPVDTDLENGLALFGKHDFFSAAGQLNTFTHKVMDRQTNLATNAWSSKAVFFKKEDRYSDQLRRYSDSQGWAVYVLEHKLHRFTVDQGNSDIDMALMIAHSENMFGHIDDYEIDGGTKYGARKMLELVGEWIRAVNPKYVPPILHARYHEALAEMHCTLHQQDEARRQAKLALDWFSKCKPSNRFESNENQLWIDFSNERFKKLNLI